MNPVKLGPYDIQKKIGEGGMGAVYLGTHTQDGRQAAIKLLPETMAKRPGFRDRFEAEIESLRKLEHPNIVQLYGYGEEDGQLFYAMEYVPGKNLQEELDNGKRFTWLEVVNMGIALAEALRHAHLHGIIHRDIKPANIMMRDDGMPKLTDFGIARLYGVEGLTMAGGPLGTAHYMAPEQSSSNNKITEHADFYALGGTFYALLAGRPPFVAQSMLQLLDMHKKHTPLPVNQIVPDVPEELSVVISTMLHKAPNDRVASATMLVKSLKAVRDAIAFRQNTLKPQAPLPLEEPQQEHIRTQVFPRSDAAGQTVKLGEQALGNHADLDQTIATSLPEDADPDATIFSSEPTAIPLKTSDQVASDGDELAESDDPEESQSMFITAEEARQMDRERLDEEARQQPRSIPLISIILVIVALLLAGTLWYRSRPLSPQTLLTRIDAIQNTSDPYQQSVLLDYMQQYEQLAPANDPKVVEFAQLKNDLEIQDLERKLRQRARYRLNNASSLSMVEQTLLQVIHLIPNDPQLAMVQLDALQILFVDPMIKRSPRDDRLLGVAQLLHQRASQTLATYQGTYLKPIDDQLDRAEHFLDKNPTRTQHAAQAIITLYASHPWAASRIERAKELAKRAQAQLNGKTVN